MYNEEDALATFFDVVQPVLQSSGMDYEIVCVDDGSRDGTFDLLCDQAANEPTVRAIRLSRNFGKEAALTAGIDHVCGDVVVPMDVDLQDPPDLLPTFIDEWEAGYDVVFGVRSDRSRDSWLKRLTSKWFYGAYNRVADRPVPANAGDFRLMDRSVIDAVRELRERNRFMKGLFNWVGFNQKAVPYARPERVAGTTKWKYWKLWNFALDGITASTTAPLRLWTYVGVVTAALAFVYGGFIVGRTLIQGVDVPGYASLFTSVLFLGGLQLISLGTIGEYIGRIHMEVKQRPIYIVAEHIGKGASDKP